MEFNPLDLLASAAELQQRHDESPDIMTRQKKATTLPNKVITINSVPKEKDPNRSGKNNGVIVVKKIKIGGNSDLEKMLDEHNYGNAKKGIKLEKSFATATGDDVVSGTINSASTSRHEPLENGQIEIQSAKEADLFPKNTSTITSTFVSECDKSGKNVTSNTSCLLPEVGDNSDNRKLTSIKGSANEPKVSSENNELQIQLPDSLHAVPDNIILQTDSKVLSQPDSETSDTNAKTNDSSEFQKQVESIHCLESLTDQSNGFKKDTVRISPGSNVIIHVEEKNKEMLSKEESSCNHSKINAHSVPSEDIDILSGKSNTKEGLDCTGDHLCHMVNDHNDSKAVTIIKSLLSKDNSSRSVKTTKLHNNSLRVNCDTENYLRVLEEKMATCDSPRSRLDLDPFCNSSSNGIHLLSPDRRNPDSVGIVESPVASAFTDSSNSFETETELGKLEESLPLKGVTESSKNTKIDDDKADLYMEVLNTGSDLNRPEQQKLEFSDASAFSEAKKKVTISVKEPVVEQGTSQSQAGGVEKEQTGVYRFESDHCYAGLPGKINSVDPRELPNDEETDSDEEEADHDASSPSASTELSQDSGYGDITQSPECEKKEDISVRHNPEKLVPVLISINKSGALTVHTDKGISKELPKQIFTLSENQTLDSNANLLNVDKAHNLNKPVASTVRPLLLSPIGKGTASVLIDQSKILVDPKTVTNIVNPPAKPLTSQTHHQQVSPPKFGKFRIGTFASFSNTGMDIDSPVKSKTKAERTPKTSPFSRSSSHPSNLSSLKSPGDRSLLRHMDSYRGSSSHSSPVIGYTNHIEHDHDYYMHSFMPSTIDSAKENTQKDSVHKSKSSHGKTKKYESELQKELLKNDKPGKRKGKGMRNIAEKDDSLDEMELMLDEERYRDLPTYAESVRAKTRTEKYIEQKSSEPKMKITGSSKFQDQFVYFMNTKKRSRRRESRDSNTPFQVPLDRIILPPHKPGDIVVPHLTDADIENLKLFNKQNKVGVSATSTQQSDPFNSKITMTNSQSTTSETNTDEESKIINTILSLENENLTEEQVPYSENTEMYGQSDILNLLPEQMNLTQEQMDLLFSAVDEVQNSSPSLVPDKLTTATGDPTFGQFPAMEQSFSDPVEGKSVLETADKVTDHSESASVKTTTDGGVPSETPLAPVIETPIAESSDKCESSTDGPAGEDLLPKPSENEDENSTVLNCDTQDNLVTDSNVISKTPATLSEVINDTVTNGSFTSLNQNSESDNTENELSQDNNSSLTFSNLSSSVNPDLPLPTLDRSSLDILGSDYKLDRSDLFPEATLQDTPQSVSGSMPVPAPLDYTAPWIVTVSMYWNDLPAIMINNLPYVRLVDIHKQILPAKDTGILKKRCQLMGIEVGNCTEMQRYFLVQYGKAINSKSTLIVSKDAAKVLIGYYVDPQPAKGLNAPREHKSIIEHRREQLRRIALAKRAALRAERMEKERAQGEKAGSNLLKPVEGGEAVSSLGVPDAPIVPPRQRSQSLSTRYQHHLSPGSKYQRSTRHKKINFLELLRGDSSTNLTENTDTVNDNTDKKKHISSEGIPNVKSGTKRKRRSDSGDRRAVKVVKYIASDSNESVSDSEYTDEDSSDSSEEEQKFVVVKKPKKKRASLFNRKNKKGKYKKKVVLKKNIVKVPSFKVKFRQGKQVTKDQIKPGKNASISQVQIVKINSDHEKSVSKQLIKTDIAMRKDIESSEHSHCVAVKTESVSKSGIKENAILSSNDSCINIVKKNEITNLKQALVTDQSTEENKQVTVSTETLPEIDPVINRKDESNGEVTENTEILKGIEQKNCNDLIEEIKVEDEIENKNNSCESDMNVDQNQCQLTNTESGLSNISEQTTEQMEKESNFEVKTTEIVNNRTVSEADVSICAKDSVQQGIKQTHIETATHIPQEHRQAERIDNIPIASCSSEDLPGKTCVNSFGNARDCIEADNLNSGKTDSTSTITASVCSDSNLSEISNSRVASRCSEPGESTVGNVNFFLLSKDTDVEEEIPPVRIVHRDVSLQNSGVRSRRQLGEIFVEHYNTKRSFCIRCYTCRKMMSVDHFMRHLHDVSGGLISTDVPQTIEPSDSDMTDSELKAWEVFQRKKELFDNNQLPSDVVRSNIVCNVDSDSNQSFAEKPAEEPCRGPIIIQTPVSPQKSDKIKLVPHSKPEQRTKKKIPALSQNQNNKTLEKSKSWSPVNVKDGIRASSRKRKASQLYSSDEYTFYKKLPRLQQE